MLILITAACGGTTTTTSDSQPSASPTPTTGLSATFTPPPGDEATVVRIFDGDSFEAELDGEIVEVRMLGINAPEGFECHGDAARDRLRELTTDVRVILSRPS